MTSTNISNTSLEHPFDEKQSRCNNNYGVAAYIDNPQISFLRGNMARKGFVRLLFALTIFISTFAWIAPAQAAGGKSIIVSLSRQRLYAYQGGKLVYSAAVNARGTRVGSFRIQNKLGLVGSVIPGWRLSYWMGIYYVGRVQNGIHGPEIGRNGKVVATASLGCVVLRSATDAAWIYRWAGVGTPVIIRR
jgi:hypothetical protein